jgi:hypothetical protein
LRWARRIAFNSDALCTLRISDILRAMKVAWMVVIVALGCGKKDSAPDPAKTPEPAKVVEPAKPPEPFKGPLTVAILMGAKGTVSSLEPWQQGFAKLQAKLGAPTKVDGDKKYSWAVMDGDDCAYVYVTKEDGKQFGVAGEVVSSVSSPSKVGKSDPPGNRNECLAILGKDGPPEDPNALPPPADGKVTVAMLVDNASQARSKWDGQQVTVTGKLGSVSTTTSNGTGTTTVYLTDAKDPNKQIGCTVEGMTSLKTSSNKPLTAKATVAIRKMMNGAGETVYSIDLTSCTLAK